MNKNLVIFPNNLYAVNRALAKQYQQVFIVEEPSYFSSPYKISKVKLAYLVAAMHAHHDSCIPTAKYITHQEAENFLKSLPAFDAWDPLDNDLSQKYPNMQLINSPLPNFLLTPSDLEEYYKSHKTSMSHSSFYKFSKSKLNILNNIPNLDKENRLSIKQAPEYKDTLPVFKSKYYKLAQDYVEKTFPDHIGTTEHVMTYPIAPAHAKRALKDFIKHRLNNFGPFEDSIDKENILLYHSCLSAAMNIGILLPKDVTASILKVSNQAPMNSIEGFIRQVAGWREYTRYLYKYHAKEISLSNHWQNKQNISKSWYTATTNIEPLDNEIKKALKYGYSHHIIRLMVFLNLLLLTRVHPQQMMKWFMEVVSIDAYPWVMLTNIYMMSWSWTKAMKKPYISTSSYILRMSNYKRGPWCKTWDDLFYKFIKDKREKFIGTSKIYLTLLRDAS